MLCLNTTQMSVTETLWALRSPRLLHRNCPLDFIATVPFQLPFLYVNHYLITFSLTAHLFIQQIMMQLPQTGKNLQSCEGTENTVRPSWYKNHIILEFTKQQRFCHSISWQASLHHQKKYVFSILVTSLLHADFVSRHQSKCLCWLTQQTLPVIKVLFNTSEDICSFGLGWNVQTMVILTHAIKDTKEKDMLTDRRSKAVKWLYKNKRLEKEIIFPTNSTLTH